MNIEGKFTDKETIEKETLSVQANKIFEITDTGFTESKFSPSKYPADVRDKIFAFKPKQTQEKIFSNFVKFLKKVKYADGDFIDKVTKEGVNSVQVRYFEVFYVDGELTIDAPIKLMSNRGYQITSEVKNGKVVSSTQQVTVKSYQMGSDIPNTRQSHVKGAYKSCFTSDFYKIFNAQQEDLVPTKDLIIIWENGLDYQTGHDWNYDAKNKLQYGWRDVLKIQDTVKQVLLFPVWEISIEFSGKRYTNYLSDITGTVVTVAKEKDSKNKKSTWFSVPISNTKKTRKKLKPRHNWRKAIVVLRYLLIVCTLFLGAFCGANMTSGLAIWKFVVTLVGMALCIVPMFISYKQKQTHITFKSYSDVRERIAEIVKYGTRDLIVNIFSYAGLFVYVGLAVNLISYTRFF